MRAKRAGRVPYRGTLVTPRGKGIYELLAQGIGPTEVAKCGMKIECHPNNCCCACCIALHSYVQHLPSAVKFHTKPITPLPA